MKRYAALAFAGLTALSLVACQKEEAAGETPAATAQATATPDAAIAEVAGKLKSGANQDAAQAVGKAIAERAIAAGIKAVCFDRGSYRYHGRVAALANAAREAGLSF